MPDAANPQMFGETKLGDLRKKLLDLTDRNKLINYRHTKAASLRIIDELPDQLLEKFTGDKVLKFGPVPQPTEAELVKGKPPRERPPFAATLMDGQNAQGLEERVMR